MHVIAQPLAELQRRMSDLAPRRPRHLRPPPLRRGVWRGQHQLGGSLGLPPERLSREVDEPVQTITAGRGGEGDG